jgi:hypothetical protein
VNVDAVLQSRQARTFHMSGNRGTVCATLARRAPQRAPCGSPQHTFVGNLLVHEPAHKGESNV